MYKQGNGCITRVEDGAVIPLDEDNMDYKVVLVWLAAGNSLIPADAPSRDALVAKVNEMREQHLAAGMSFAGHSWDSDDRSRANLSGTVAFVATGNTLPAGFTWRTKDNQNVTMDNAGIVGLGAAMLVFVNTCYAVSWSLKAQLLAANDPNVVDLTAGWPAPA